jgi:hypothetical protein
MPCTAYVLLHGALLPPPSAGKTQSINHYLVNRSWYLVDCPGYGEGLCMLLLQACRLSSMFPVSTSCTLCSVHQMRVAGTVQHSSSCRANAFTCAAQQCCCGLGCHSSCC